MNRSTVAIEKSDARSLELALVRVHTLVIGSGAAGLSAAMQLKVNGVDDVLILTEGLQKGTSINTGSDKQTYYKLSMCGAESDSPAAMAETYFAGGSMHGDLALVEASLSSRAFMNLVNLGVRFPRDEYGQFVGYKTDHDPLQRATSVGPHTSREMCRALIRRVQELGIVVMEDRNAVRLLTLSDAGGKRACGAVAVTGEGAFEVYLADNVVFAVGGPGGIYRTSVYPDVHTGAIGLALLAGARAQGLPESQYGMASTAFRWNVSGTYMQVVPRFISTAADGESDCREFLREYFDSPGELNSMVFLKGYHWPFDSRKAIGGSSLIDILVYNETVLRDRRVFLDFRSNPQGFLFEELSDEASTYLSRSDALQETPIERLHSMNPGAIELYEEHGIDIAAKPLEIAVCAQHNNGGLAADLWWESVNIGRLFPVGEANGSHGVYRPGGASLNAGQVGAFRAAELIANRYAQTDLQQDAAWDAARAAVVELVDWVERCSESERTWQEEREEFQARMSRAGAHIRSAATLGEAVAGAWAQFRRLAEEGCRNSGGAEVAEALGNLQLCFAQAVYLEAIQFAVKGGVGSRGSAAVLSASGEKVHDGLGDEWRLAPEEKSFREKVLETEVDEAGRVVNRWVDRRPLPDSDPWFETEWAKFRSGAIYGEK